MPIIHPWEPSLLLHLGILSLSLLLLAGSSAHAQLLPNNFTVEGRLFDTGTPASPLDNEYDFRVEIVKADQSCVYYRELHTAVDLRSSSPELIGRFSLKVGGGTAQFGSLLDAFASSTPAGDSDLDNTGDANGDCATFPAAGSNRQVRIWVKLTSAGSFTVPLSPNIVITSTPSALVAETLQGYLPNQLLRVNSGQNLTQANLESVFSNYTQLQHLLNNSFSGSYSFNNQVLTDVGAPTAAGDAVNRGWVDTHLTDKAADLSGVSLGTNNGHTIIWDAANNRWTTGAPTASDSTKLPLTGGVMTGPVTFSGHDLFNTGHITLGTQKMLTLGRYTNAQESGLTMGAGDAGRIFFNIDQNQFRMWNGSGYVSFGATGAAGGDLAGNYPNPTIANDRLRSDHIDSTNKAINRIVMTHGTNPDTLIFKTCATGEVLQWTVSGWGCAAINSGLTYVEAGTGLSGGAITGTGTLSVDVGTTDGKIVQVTTGDRLPAIDGRDLTHVNAAYLRGINLSTTAPANGHILKYNGSAWEAAPFVAGTNAGEVQFKDGLSLNSNAAFVWDNTNIRLGLNTGSPAATLHVNGASRLAGQVLAGNGNSGTPAYSFATSSNTGLFSPGVNILAISTGSTERFRIDADGGVGIGTNSPSASAILDLASTSKGFLPPRMNDAEMNAIVGMAGLVVYNTTHNGLYVYDGSAWTALDGGGGGAITALTGDVAASGSGSVAATINNDAVTSAKIADGTIVAADLDSTLTDRMWSENSGNVYRSSGGVGIGISTPQATLHVSRSGTAPMWLSNETVLVQDDSNPATLTLVGGVTGSSAISFGDTSNLNGAIFYDHNSKYFAIYTDLPNTGQAQMIVQDDGRVGIGTTAPNAHLEVAGQFRTISPSTSGSHSNATNFVDWNNGNAQETSANCSASISFSNMLDGGTYILAVTDSGTTMCTFTSAGLTFYFSPGNGPRTSGTRTIYTFQRINSSVYVSWNTGFQ